MKTIMKFAFKLVLLAAGLNPAEAATIQDALDTPGWTWTATNSAGSPLYDWFGQTTITHDGVDAAQSGPITNSQWCSIRTTVTGPGILTFWSKGQPQSGAYGQLMVDGVAYLSLPREAQWHAAGYSLASGPSDVEFQVYQNDYSGTNGTLWLDQVTFSNYTGLPPRFVEPPASAQVGDSDPWLATAVVTGEQPFFQQWQHDGTNQSAWYVNSPNLDNYLYSVGPADTGSWRLIVTNGFGAVTSAVYTLTITSTPPHEVSIVDGFYSYQNPLPIVAGSGFALDAWARGSAPLYYQWRQDGTNLVGETNSSLTFSGFAAGQQGQYTCLVSNHLATAESASIRVVLSTDPPLITYQSWGTGDAMLDVTTGGYLNVYVTAGGGLPLNYQWEKDGSDLAGWTNPYFTIYSLAPLDTGVYRVRVWNALGSVLSSNLTVIVDGRVPLGQALNAPDDPWASDNNWDIAGGWFGQTNTTHDGVSAAQTVPTPYLWLDYTDRLWTRAQGPATLSYWWKLDGSGGDTLALEIRDPSSSLVYSTNIPAGTDWQQVTLALPAGSNLIRWIYHYDSAIGMPSTGWVDEVQITPQAAYGIFIYQQPEDQWVPWGGFGMFTCLASNNPPSPLAYQWERNGYDVYGATDSTYGTGVNGTYRCRVTDGVTTNWSRDALLDFEALFPDPSLAAAVRTNLGLLPASPIPMTSVWAMTQLTANYVYYGGLPPITNLAGLENAISLQRLYLNSHSISNLTPLAGLTGLTWLELDYNHVSDVSPLLNLKQLRGLRLNSNTVTNAPLVTALTNLQTLVLTQNGLTNIAFLASMPKLTNLWCGANLYTNLSPIAGLTNLQELRLTSLPIRDFSLLSSFTNLTTLAAGNNSLTNASFADNLTQLRYLYLEASFLTNAPVLTNKPWLRYLWLYNNRLTRFPDLHGLTELTWLDLSGNLLSDIGSVTNAPALNTLFLQNNLITDIAPLLSLTNLTSVWLAGNQLDTNAASADMAVINTLRSRGATVGYLPQNTVTAIVLSAPRILPGNQFVFTISSPPGAVLEVLASGSPSGFTTLATITNTTGTASFTNAMAPGANRFYRARQQ